jgi:hypothetical protein
MTLNRGATPHSIYANSDGLEHEPGRINTLRSS